MYPRNYVLCIMNDNENSGTAQKLDNVNVIGYIHWAFVDGYEFVAQHSEAEPEKTFS